MSMPRLTTAPAPSPVFTSEWQSDVKRIAVLLGRGCSSTQLLEASAILTHSKRAAPDVPQAVSRDAVRQIRQAIHNTRLIDALNRNRKWARRRLSERIAPLLREGTVVVVVPSHDPWAVETPLRALAQDVARASGVDGTGCLVRHTKIARIVYGGPSTPALHRQTIRVENADVIAGRNVLLLDDIAKSGNSLRTCRDLLYQAGASWVQPAALGWVSGTALDDLNDLTCSPFFFALTPDPNTAAMNQEPSPELEPIPGDTYPLRAELKALGAVWNPAHRDWRITPDKLPLASALVAHQALIPPKGLPTDADGEIIDPFEQDDTPRTVALEKQDGATYGAKDTLRAVGARWDKAARQWLIREERASYARAVLRDTAGVSPAPTLPVRLPPTKQAETTVTPPPHATPAAPPLAVREARSDEYTATPAPPRPSASGRIRLAGLWIARDEDGRTYLTGKLSPTIKLLIVRNESKTSDNQPSHVVYLAPVEPDDID